MKKILILITLLFLFGCDYKEITDSSVATIIGIDKEKDEYVITALIPRKEENKTNLYKGKGFSLSSAFNDLNLNLEKNISFSHLQTMIISDVIAKEGTNEIIKYFIKDEEVQKNFYFFVSKDTTAVNILNSLLKTNNNDYNTLTNVFIKHNKIKFKNNSIAFHDFVNNVLTKGKDATLHSITLNKDKVIPSNIALFKNEKLVDFSNNIIGYSLLSKKAKEILLDLKYKDELITVLIYNINVKSYVKDKNIYYKINSKVRVKENPNDIKIEKDLKNIIENNLIGKMINLNKECKKYNTDIFGFENDLEKHYAKKEFKDIDLKINLNLKYEKDGKYE